MQSDIYRFVLENYTTKNNLYFGRCKSVNIMGTVYSVEKCWLMIGTTVISFGTVLQFGMLYDIILQGCNQEPNIYFVVMVMDTLEPNIYFVVMVMDTLGYDPILGAYK